jgi:Ricin-type beta-trefoil lectin domain-like
MIVLGAGKNNGNSVVQWDAPQREEDDWCFVDKGAGFFAIYNRGSGKVLAVPAKSLVAGAKLIQWEFANIDDQLWKIVPVAISDDCLKQFGPVPTTGTCDYSEKLGIYSHLNNKENDLLNTAFDNETPEMTATRLAGSVPREDPENIDALYNPVFDAFCFNEDYPVPSLSVREQRTLYFDYKVEFDRVQILTTDVSEENNRVTNDRIPGMFLRMCFHDNAINPSQPDFQDYISKSIDNNKWIGEARFLNTSGADASNLICFKSGIIQTIIMTKQLHEFLTVFKED